MYTPKLIVLSGVNRGQIYELDGSKITCGRSKKCSITIHDNTVSTLHCTIYQDGDSWFIVDENSSNGTRVNNIPTKKQKLEYMDILQIGSEELMFNIDCAVNTNILRTTTGIEFDKVKDVTGTTMKNVSPFYNPFKGRTQKKVIGIIITTLILTVISLLGLLAWFVFYKV